VHDVLVTRDFDVLVSHRLDCFLLRLHFILVDLEFDPVLSQRLLLFLKTNLQSFQLISNSLLVGLEESDLLGVNLIELALLFDFKSSAIKVVLLDLETLDLLLKYLVLRHDLPVLVFEFCFSHLELILVARVLLSLLLYLE